MVAVRVEREGGGGACGAGRVAQQKRPALDMQRKQVHRHGRRKRTERVPLEHRERHRVRDRDLLEGVEFLLFAGGQNRLELGRRRGLAKRGNGLSVILHAPSQLSDEGPTATTISSEERLYCSLNGAPWPARWW